MAGTPAFLHVNKRTIVNAAWNFKNVLAGFPGVHAGRRLVGLLRHDSGMKTGLISDSAAAWIGRSLAACVHPYAAWRAFSARKRLMIAVGYFAAGFISVLSALLLSSAPSL